MEKELDIEQISLRLIANSGDARSYCYQAMKAAREERYEDAKNLMEESNACSLKAHKAQSELLFAEANGKKQELNLLLVHAQDHLMTSLLAQDLVEEIIYLHQYKETRRSE